MQLLAVSLLASGSRHRGWKLLLALWVAHRWLSRILVLVLRLAKRVEVALCVQDGVREHLELIQLWQVCPLMCKRDLGWDLLYGLLPCLDLVLDVPRREVVGRQALAPEWVVVLAVCDHVVEGSLSKFADLGPVLPLLLAFKHLLSTQLQLQRLRLQVGVLELGHG